MKTRVVLCTLFMVCNIAFSEDVRLFGSVSDDQTGIGIKDVLLILQPGNYKTRTNELGEYTFSSIPAGSYKLTVGHPRYIKIQIDKLILEKGKKRELVLRFKRKKNPSSERPLFNSSKSRARVKKTEKATETDLDIKFSESEHPPVLEMESMELGKPAVPPGESGLRAGYADDNQQFNYFINFLDKFKLTPHYPLNISERIRLNTLDRAGRPVHNAQIEISEKGRLLTQGYTFADGSFYIFPQDINLQGEQIEVKIQKGQQFKSVTLERSGLRDVSVQLSETRNVGESIPLDLLFILDATGSMGEEIARLKSSIEIINLNLTALNIKPKIRFGLVAYRDQEDDYVTWQIPFTENLDLFRKELQKVHADGGGDTPEDLQSALDDALHKMEWNPQGLRLTFIITDAGLHLDYEQEFTYANAAREAKQRAIKIFSVGTGGLDISGEYILRQIAQYTSGKYIFLTYGETGESEGGRPGSVSHHTGSNFNVENLESIIIRFAKEELAHVSDMAISDQASWFEANAIDDESRQETLKILFNKALQELIDYSSLTIETGTTIAALPIVPAYESQANNAEYFYEQLSLALSKNQLFRIAERNDLQQITKEISLKLSSMTENDQAAKIGAFIGARLLITGKLFFNEHRYEIFLKLLRVETAEVLSITQVRIDPKLGI